jgi:hypothetical protein
MADQRDDDTGSEHERQRTAGQQSHRSEYGGQAGEQQESMATQGSEGSFGGESSGRPADEGDGMSGQPIGGNDSNTGSGTTLTAGYEPPSAGPGHSSPSAGDGRPLSSDGTGVLAADQSGRGGVHTRPTGNADGAGTTSNMGGSSADADQSSGGSSGTSGGKGFIGASGNDSGDYVQDPGRATDMGDDSSMRQKGGGSQPEGNFAMGELGRGAEDQQGNESDSSSSGSFTAGGSDSDNDESDF